MKTKHRISTRKLFTSVRASQLKHSFQHVNKVAEAAVDFDKRFPRLFGGVETKTQKTQAWAREAKEIMRN